MRPRPVLAKPLLGTLLVAHACTGAPRPFDDAIATGIRIELAAAIAADAVRAVLPGADPLPQHAGAPVTPLHNGGFAIRYECRGDGRWLPRATARIATRVSLDAPPITAIVAAHALDGAARPTAELVVHATPVHEGASITVTGPSGLAHLVREHVRRGVAFAADDGAVPCCAQHAPWQAHRHGRLAAALEARGDLAGALAEWQRAQAFGGDLPELRRRLGTVAAALGLDEQALPHLRAARLQERDPVAAAAISRLMQQIEARRAPENGGRLLRDEAMRLLREGELDRAAALAHAAAARAPDTVADLQVRHRLMRRLGDHGAALGSALLLREYGAGPNADVLLVHDLAATGHDALAHAASLRCVLDPLPRASLLAELAARAAERAADPAAELVEAAAVPPR